jgi:hypothetical protein
VITGCHSEAGQALVDELGAEQYLIAQRLGDPGTWRLQAFDLKDGPTRIEGRDSILLALADSSDLPVGTWLTREHFGVASCALFSPLEIRALHEDEDGYSWVPAEMPDALRGILEALVRPECLRCVAFDTEGVTTGDPGLLRGLPSATVLASGKVLGATRDGQLWLLGPGETPRPVSGCLGPGAWVLAANSRVEGLFAGRGSELHRLELDEDAASCRSTVVHSAPGDIVHATVTPVEWPLQWLVTSLRITDEPDVAVTLYDGVRTSTIAQFSATIDVSSEGVPKLRGRLRAVFQAPDEILVSTGYQDILHHHLGELEAVRLANTRAIEGLSVVPGWGAIASISGDLRNTVAFDFEPATGRPRELTRWPQFFSVAAPFRGGWLAVGRGGSLFEYHRDTGNCPVQLELMQGNHAAEVLLAAPGESYLVDLVDTDDAQAAWLRPRRAPLPDPKVFPGGP